MRRSPTPGIHDPQNRIATQTTTRIATRIATRFATRSTSRKRRGDTTAVRHRFARLLGAAIVASTIAAPLAADAATPTGTIASQVPPAIAASLAKIGRVVAPPPTAALYAPLQQREPYPDVSVTRSIAYGDDPRHLLDVFEPATRQAARPVLVFVHGGAFTRGDRRTGDSPFYDNVMLWAVANGMVGVNMTYRLAPAHRWPAAQEDIARAVGWIRGRIGAHGGDPTRVVLMGHSAGAAHVAQYVGHSRFHTVAGSGLAGAVMVSGLYDPTTAEANPPLRAYFGEDPSAYAARSALPGMRASALPMLLAYAELDPDDFHRQAEQARTALCDAGRCRPTLKLLGHSHMSELYAINTEDRAFTDALKAFVADLPR
ncbi:MAG: alpha/beta hydrolase [Lautropia sp.]